MKIAIDGPSGAGKSTVAKRLAAKLKMVYLDTGAMYRAVALYVSKNNIALTEESLAFVLPDINIDIKYKDDAKNEQKSELNGTQSDIKKDVEKSFGQAVWLNGEDVSTDIRRHFMSKLASDVSALPPVRLFLVDLQRKLAQKNEAAGVILDGRDIGTFVLPDAELKFYLTAAIHERAKRRFLELEAKGEVCDIRQIKIDIEKRDYNDMNRAFAPLRKADDAIEIDSTNMTIEEVVEFMAQKIKEKSR